MSDYVVTYEQAEDGGWGAYIPDLPGVVAVARHVECDAAARTTRAA
jgi:predicted RNase H-like HicB family nuclease